MAETKFTAIYTNNEGKIIEKEIPGMNTYKIAEKFAIMLNDPEETKLVCVVELQIVAEQFYYLQGCLNLKIRL